MIGAPRSGVLASNQCTARPYDAGGDGDGGIADSGAPRVFQDFQDHTVRSAHPR